MSSVNDKLNIVTMAQKQTRPTQEVEFKDKMFLTVSFLPRPTLQKIYKESQTMKMQYKTGIRAPETDNDKFSAKFCAEVVKDWRGFTPRKISELINIDLSQFSPEELDEQIPFSQDQIAFLVKEAYDLDTFLQNYCQDLSNFAPQKEYEEGNSEASQSGN